MSGSGAHRSYGLANRHQDDRGLGEGRHPRMTPIGSALVPRRRRVGSRAIVFRRFVEKSSFHQELERRSARLGGGVGVLGVRGREGGGRWVPGSAGLWGRGGARRRGKGVVRRTTIRRFPGEGPREPIAPRRWTTSAGFGDIGDLGPVLGDAERMRFGLLRRDHHSWIVGHVPDQPPSRASSSRDCQMGVPMIGVRFSYFLGQQSQVDTFSKGERLAVQKRL